jgi:Cu/Zn superoxide dismutase
MLHGPARTGHVMRQLCALLGIVSIAVFAGGGTALAASKGQSSKTLVVVMKADEEVPHCDPATNAARGNAVFRITDASTGTVTYKLVANNLPGDITAAHIHQSPAGQPGAIVQPLSLTAGATNGVIGRGTFTNPELVNALKSDPAGYYVNVHSSVCPTGVIRGQFGGHGKSS